MAKPTGWFATTDRSAKRYVDPTLTIRGKRQPLIGERESSWPRCLDEVIRTGDLDVLNVG
jgi:hypothetical protein